MRDLGTPVQPQRLFAAMADAFGDDLWIGVAWQDDEPVAGGVGFRWDARVRDDLGVLAPRVQQALAQHGALLGVHGACLQLRT